VLTDGIYVYGLCRSERMRTSRPSIAMCSGEEELFEFQVLELGADFTTRAKDEEQAVQQILASIF
jgi:hypothetical protein